MTHLKYAALLVALLPSFAFADFLADADIDTSKELFIVVRDIHHALGSNNISTGTSQAYFEDNASTSNDVTKFAIDSLLENISYSDDVQKGRVQVKTEQLTLSEAKAMISFDLALSAAADMGRCTRDNVTVEIGECENVLTYSPMIELLATRLASEDELQIVLVSTYFDDYGETKYVSFPVLFNKRTKEAITFYLVEGREYYKWGSKKP